MYGPESSGKTTFALHVLAQAQKLGGTCALTAPAKVATTAAPAASKPQLAKPEKAAARAAA